MRNTSGSSAASAAREAWPPDRVADVLGAATEIARALTGFHEGLTPGMIRWYAHRGRIPARGEGELGCPLYRVGDMLALLTERTAG